MKRYDAGSRVCIALVFAACGGTVENNQAGDAAPSDARGTEGGKACNALANTAEVLQVPFVAEEAPATFGGTILDGTYVMTSAVEYTGVGGPSGSSGTTSQVTIVVSGGIVQVAAGGPPPDDHLTVSITTKGSALTYAYTCPKTFSEQGSFTAASDSLIVELPAGMLPDEKTQILVETFARQ
jgi:hypothetical protein